MVRSLVSIYFDSPQLARNCLRPESAPLIITVLRVHNFLFFVYTEWLE